MVTRMLMMLRALTAVVTMALWVPTSVTGQPREDPALVNQGSQETWMLRNLLPTHPRISFRLFQGGRRGLFG